MGTLTVVCGAKSRENVERIGRYARAEGLVVKSLAEFLKGQTEQAILLLIDAEELLALSRQLFNILFMRCPIVLIPSSESEMERLRRDAACPCEVASYPFTRQEFIRLRQEHVDGRTWERRTMVFGRLAVDRGNRQVFFGGVPLCLTAYDYEILLVLAENLGDVVSRETINELLPERQRTSLRNVDTHIKQIRRHLGTAELIQCIRSVGYCIPEESVRAVPN